MDFIDGNSTSDNQTGAWELVTGRKRNLPVDRDPRKQKKAEVTVSNSFQV